MTANIISSDIIIPTHIELVNDQLDLLPLYRWTDSYTTFCDLSLGNGT